MDFYKEKLLRKLKVRCSEVNKELIEVNGIYEQSIPLFCSEVSFYCKKNNLKNPLDKLNEEKREETKKRKRDIDDERNEDDLEAKLKSALLAESCH